MRRIPSVLALALLGAAALSAPADAAPVDRCSDTLYAAAPNLSQQACVGYNSTVGITGHSKVVLPSNFATSHVTACTFSVTLVSTYGTTNKPLRSTGHYPNCLTAIHGAHPGGSFDTDGLNFGPGSGRRGDGYSLHACVTYTTAAATRTNCTTTHPASPKIYPWG